MSAYRNATGKQVYTRLIEMEDYLRPKEPPPIFTSLLPDGSTLCVGKSGEVFVRDNQGTTVFDCTPHAEPTVFIQGDWLNHI